MLRKRTLLYYSYTSKSFITCVLYIKFKYTVSLKVKWLYFHNKLSNRVLLCKLSMQDKAIRLIVTVYHNIQQKIIETCTYYKF